MLSTGKSTYLIKLGTKYLIKLLYADMKCLKSIIRFWRDISHESCKISTAGTHQHHMFYSTIYRQSIYVSSLLNLLLITVSYCVIFIRQDRSACTLILSNTKYKTSEHRIPETREPTTAVTATITRTSQCMLGLTSSAGSDITEIRR